jgi:acyl carrier protein
MESTNSIYGTAVTLLSERFGVPTAAIRPDSTFEELDVDSLALAEFAFVLQDEYAVLLTTDDVSRKSTLTDVARLLAERLPSQPPAAS